MKQTKNVHDFLRAFELHNRTNFSRDALRNMFEAFEEFEHDAEEEIELDVIGICCDFSEYDSLEDYNEQQGREVEDMEELHDEGHFLCQVDENGFVLWNH